MLVEDVMTKRVISVSPNTSIERVIKKMAKHNVGGLPVKKNSEIVGFITDRDIVLRAFGKSKHTRIHKVMSKEVYLCFSNQHVKAAVSAMGQLRVRRLPVLNEERKLVGILSLSDLTKNEQVWNETQPLFNQLKLSA